MRRILLLSVVTCLGVATAAEEWTRYAEKDGVVSYNRSMTGSRLMATRGVSTVEHDACVLMGIYLDVKRATDWVDLLVQLDEHPGTGDDAIERHIYDMPWPVADREFVFKRTVVWDHAAKSVVVSYKSVEDERYPEGDEYVRGIDHGSFWRFTKQADGKTEIEAVAMVDPAGSLPQWLFNSVQRSWPRESILGLSAQAAKGDATPYPGCAAW